MLQISTGKFFEYDSWETLRRAVYFGNYRLPRHEKIETSAGSLLSTADVGSLGAVTAEIVERLQKSPGGPVSGEIAATSGETLINDFAAVVSFALCITCTPDHDLAGRLISADRLGLVTNTIPQKIIPRMFDTTVHWQPSDAERLKTFVAKLMALERKSYEGAIRAIRRFVVGTHRVSDDINLAYSLFVMSIESLAQDFDEFQPTWENYDQSKRRSLDAALEGAPQATVEKVRSAILANEHIALSSRFREFTLAYLDPSFFRGEAAAAIGPISRPDLSIALRQAYTVRSKYVHHLRDIPPLIVRLPGFHETIEIDGKPNLTFAGLVRVAQHVIRSFVERSPKTVQEKFDWRKDLPGVLRLQLDSSYWIGNPVRYDVNNAKAYLEAFIGQVVKLRLDATAGLTDMRNVLEKIESIIPSIAKPSQRLPMLALFFIFNQFAPASLRSSSYPALIEKYRTELDAPSIESLAAHLVVGQDPDWTLLETENLHAEYFSSRKHASSLQLGPCLEAAFTLHLAELNRSTGQFGRARQLIAQAVEIFPGHKGLCELEEISEPGEPPSIVWSNILFPLTTRSEEEADSN